ADERYVTCSDESFSGHLRYLTTKGPEENDATSPLSNAYDLVTTGALGQSLAIERFSPSGSSTSRMAFSYDVLGHVTGVDRFANPSSSSGSVVSFRTDYDSRGQALRYREPAAAERSFLYDVAGHLVGTNWVDGSNTRSIQWKFDGMGRLIRS